MIAMVDVYSLQVSSNFFQNFVNGHFQNQHHCVYDSQFKKTVHHAHEVNISLLY